jgi:hypothetical protein
MTEGHIAIAGVAVVGGVIWRWIEISRDRTPSPWDRWPRE